MGQLEPVADTEIQTLERPGRHLDYSKGAQGAGDAPRRHGSANLDHRAITAGEHDIDRKLHEKRVYQVGGGNHEGMTGRQAGAPEETAFSRGAVKRRFDGRGDRTRRSHVREPMIRSRIAQKRCEKVPFQNASAAHMGGGLMMAMRVRYFTGCPFSRAG